jgi:hypothetical protein
MNYSTCLRAWLASELDEVATQVAQSLQPRLQRIARFVTSFFGPRALARCGSVL